MKVIACLAASLDGKIATRDALKHLKGHPAQEILIGSDEDLKHLLAMRTEADAVLMGAGTFRAYPKPRRDACQRIIPLHAIVTRGGNLNPASPLFQHQPPVETIVFSPDELPPPVRSNYPPHVDWVSFGHERSVAAMLAVLEKRGVQTLLLEGGGEMMDLFLRAQAIHELTLTLCPLLIGGRDVPGLLSGAGFFWKEAPRTEIRSLRQVGNEIMVRLGVIYP